MHDPIDALIPHIQRVFKIQCARCPRYVEMDGDVSTALIARGLFDKGWRVKHGVAVCAECDKDKL